MKTCTIDKCFEVHYGHGLCEFHYQRARRMATRKPRTPKPCTGADCANTSTSSKGLCDKHRMAKYRAENPEHARRVAKRSNDKRKRNGYFHDYYLKNKERINERSREWAIANPEQVRKNKCRSTSSRYSRAWKRPPESLQGLGCGHLSDDKD